MTLKTEESVSLEWPFAKSNGHFFVRGRFSMEPTLANMLGA